MGVIRGAWIRTEWPDDARQFLREDPIVAAGVCTAELRDFRASVWRLAPS